MQMLVKRQKHLQKAMKNGFKTENWVYETRVEELEERKWRRNSLEAKFVYEKILFLQSQQQPCPQIGRPTLLPIST